MSLNFIRNGERWTNVTDEHIEHGGVDPTEFRWTCGLADKHFELNYDERCWYFSPVAYKKWRETNNVDPKSLNRIFRDLFLGTRK